MINFRYDILRKLGEGGSGEVFLVQDRFEPSRHYAVKVLHEGGAVSATETDEAFRNEVSALIDLSHPNLATVYDFGTIKAAEPAELAGRRFIVMELVNGADADKWLADTSLPAQEKIQVLEAVLLQALSALTYVHRNGIIHFDIKPANLVLVGEHGGGSMPLVKLMDFGFSKKADEAGGVDVRGTLEYTAPELLRGERPDHRIDLYSLGATFYHLVESKCPHENRNPVDLAKHVLNDPIEFSDHAWRDLEPLRTVVSGLLEKEPRKRYNSAAQAASELVQLHPSAAEMHKIYFGAALRPQFVGRESELARLHEVLRAFHSGSAEPKSCILLHGPDGMGKTSLIRESLKVVRSLGLEMIGTDASHPDVPFSGIERAVKLLTAGMNSLSGEARHVVEKYDGLMQLTSAANANPSAVWMAEKEKFVEVVARYICDCAGFAKTVIFADDYDRLDSVSQSVLRTVARDASAGSVLLIAATAASPESFPIQGGAEIHLDDLSPDDANRIAHFFFDDGAVATTVTAHMMQLYGGSPAVLIEAMNAAKNVLAELGSATQLASGDINTLLEEHLPKDIDEFLLRRFNRLTREQQLVMAVLSCFQEPAPMEVLVTVLPFHKRRTMDQVRYLHLDGLVRLSADGETISISMKRLKDAVYSSLEKGRDQMHAMIAAGLESIPGVRSFVTLQELGFQFHASNDTVKAASFLEQAGDEGLRLFAMQKAIALYQGAMKCLPADAEAATLERVSLKHAWALFHAGQYRESIAAAEAVSFRGAASDGGIFAIHKLIGLASSRLGETDEARTNLEAAISETPDELERLIVRQELIGLEIASGRFPEAVAACKEQIARASELSDIRSLASSYTDLGIAVFFMGEYDEAVKHFMEALKYYEAIGERTKVINSMNNIGNALSANGKFADAISYWDKAYSASQAYGTANQQAQILNNLGIASFSLRNYSKAEEYYLRARKLYERIDSQIGIAYSLSNIGEVRFAEGDLEAAIASWGEAKALYEAMETPHGHLECCLHLAGALFRLGDEQNMHVQLTEAAELIKGKSLETFMPKMHILMGQLHTLRKDYVSAAEEFGKARSALESSSSAEQYWQCMVYAAECQIRLGYPVKASEMLHEAASQASKLGFSKVVAEAMFQLGTIATEKPEALSEKAIVYFKKGLDAITKEPVSEITWKLAFALAREYHERGQSERAREYLVKTKLVVQFFLSRFKSQKMRERYLETDQKDKVLAAIETIIKR